jgi:lipoprotein-releasing system ATP-binding protein
MNDTSLSKFRNLNLGYLSISSVVTQFTALENVCIPSFIANKSQKKQGAKQSYSLISDYPIE